MYKDTAKWLLTFAPISALVTLALTLGPRLDGVLAGGFWNWVREFPVASGAVVVAVVATGALIYLCCNVLLATSDDWTTLRANTDWWSDAFSKYAVGVPLFAASTEYDDAETKAQSETASGAEQSAIAATSARILALSAEQNAKARFESFRVGYAICMLLIAGGLIFSAVSLPATPDAVTKPTKVSLVMPPGSESRFVAATGCQSLVTTTAVAVGGLWNRPRLRLVGQGCPLGVWTPTPDLNAVVVPG